MSCCFATIVSANYIAYAKVLAQSLAEHAPEVAFRVLVVDEPQPQVRAVVERSGLQAVYARDLGLPDFDRLAYKFDLVELNTALKPSFLRRLLDEGFTQAAYVDPDIRFFGPPTPILEALDGASVVLTPHTLAPVMDGLRPSDVDFLRNGTFNLGFVAVRECAEARALLAWWEERCLGLGFNDPSFGVFVDQKWMDLVPSFFADHRILRHPGCNAAYWNLHERTVAMEQGGPRVNGQPLVFFHFSGVDAARPEILSRHQTRHQLVPGSPLAQLVADYCATLLAAGHTEFRGLAYSYGRLDDGTPISGTMRRALVLAPEVRAPFAAASEFQRELRARGITPSGGTAAAPGSSTLNFDQADRRVRAVNGLLRVARRLIGVERLRQLLQYAAVLTRESNYASVLLDRPLDLSHRPKR